MNNDLISRSKLIDALNNKGIRFNAEVNRIILEQPTAYDVEKVLEALEESQDEAHRYSHNCDEYYLGEFVGYTYAIDIVKRGGVDDI